MLDSHATLEWTHKFFPWNWNTFRIHGFSFELPKSFQWKNTSLNEVIAFFKKEWKSTRIIAFWVAHRVESVMDFSQI
jgi:hypothetical protein